VRARRRRDGAAPSLAFGLLAILAACLALLALFAPASESENHRLVIDYRPALEIAILLAALGALAMLGLRPGAWSRAALAPLLLLAALLHAIDAVLPGMMGRELDLYWDLRHLPGLLGLFFEAAGAWRGGLVALAGAAALLALLGLVYGALAAIAWATRRRATAAATLAAGLLAIAAGALVPGANLELSRQIAAQARFAYRGWQVAHGHLGAYAATLGAPQRASADLARLRGRDVLLIYFESYGTVALDNPEYRAAIAPALARFESKLGEAGYQLFSDRILSPTFGGGSWLAHGTMASGIKLDQFLSRLLLDSDRRSLPRYMAAVGYRTVAVMPGLKSALPEDRFWGFDAHYNAADLGYGGPTFGWFAIPDQFTLREFTRRENHADGKPLFAEIILVSSHTPFYPVPPYRPDWSDAGEYNGVGAAEWARVYREPDWNSLRQPYLDSLVYDLDVLGDFLATRVAPGTLVIILGDHQPPAFISGDKQPWTVPIYVASQDPDLVAPFAAHGYAPGAAPAQRGPWRGMESFLPDFLDAFSGDAPPAATAPPPPG
jgi:hypothetical protein